MAEPKKVQQNKQAPETEADKGKPTSAPNIEADKGKAPIKPTIVEKKTTIAPKQGAIATVGHVPVKGATHTLNVSRETAKIINGFKK